jgi:toxin HigB-1
VIQSFKNQATEDLFNGKATKAALKLIPRNLWNVVTRKLDQIDSVVTLNELRVPPGNHLEALKKDRQSQHSIRINDQYRVCFKWTESGPRDVEVTDYHK